jgi:hypothetical protein
MCGIADWLSAAGTVATAIVAWWAFLAWRKPLRSTSAHAAAAEIAEKVRLLWYHFYDARSPWIAGGEFPRDYWEHGGNRSNAQEARGYAHVYNERWKILWPHIHEVATLRAKAGALLNDQAARALEALAKRADRLHDFFQQAVGYKRDGAELVAQYPNQEWVATVRRAVEVHPERDDPYSKDFEADLAKVNAALRRYL